MSVQQNPFPTPPRFPFALAALLAFTSACPGIMSATGETVFEETFENHPTGEVAAEDPWSRVLISPGDSRIEVVTDAENRFGRGTENRILEYRKRGTGGGQVLIAEEIFSAEVAKISFQFFQPDDGLDDHSWLILHTGRRSNENRAQVLNIGHRDSLIGPDADYERGRVHEVTLIVNNSSRPTLYGDGHAVLEGRTDIWIDGVLTRAGFSHQNNRLGPLTGFELNTSGGRRQHFFIDNLTVESLPIREIPVGSAPQPPTHPPLTPVDGETVGINPPPMIWQEADRAASYIVEMSRDESFSNPIRVEGIDLPFYNHSETLATGTWYWRHFLVADDGREIGPSHTRRFEIPENAVELPIPPTAEILANLPDHPRIFTTPQDLEAFRARRHGPAKDAWEALKWQADRQGPAKLPDGLAPLAENPPQGPTPGLEHRWSEGDDVRRQVIWLVDGEPYIAPGYSFRNLNSDASRAHILAYAYLISGEKQYADAAKDWLLTLADARIDYHLEHRAHYYTVCYSYEIGLKQMAIAYDHLYHHLTESERQKVADHIAYHAVSAYEWLRHERDIHLRYQQSHPQQTMHALLPAVLAIANDVPEAAEWADYLIRQYVNRIAWTSDDGGYFEGQTYAHKFRWILEGLVAIRTATGIDLFKQPRIANSGDFWLYTMSLNYWYEHGGDIYSLIWPWGNSADGYITNLVSAMNENPYVQWWSDTVYTNPEHVPFQYLSLTDLKSAPPVDIPQARAFFETGQVAAYNRFYDHKSDRIFFRSSPWGGHSHSHADQNNFVVHSGAEILAADAGYYTYSNDEYNREWSAATFPHNTILINGEGQPKSIDAKGEISGFFNTPDYTFFAGDASRAYRPPMERFERAILFIRPGVYVVYDELKASEPSEFSWLLNAFQEAEIDVGGRTMTVPQQDRRLRVRHLLPRDVTYEQSNERRYPIQTRAWSRFSEAFPEPYHIRVNTAENAENQRFLALLNTYAEKAGDPLESIVRIDNSTTRGLNFQIGGGTETVLFRHHLREPGIVEGSGLRADGLAATVRQNADGTLARWLLANGTAIEANGIRLAQLETTAEVSGSFEGAAAAIFRVASDKRQEIRFHLPARPETVWLVPNHDWADAEMIPFRWENNALTVRWPGNGEGTVFVDPHWNPAEALPELTLAIRDSDGTTSLPLRTFVAENGEWVAYTELHPREAGRYRLQSSREDAEILLQDRWKPRQSASGFGSAEGDFRPSMELFFRFDPAGELPRFRADLTESHRGKIVNFLRNGDFEEGIPGFPPRGWTVSRSSRSPEKGWPGWSQEDAASGKSALKFVRPNDRIATRSQPMRLPESGRHLLRFQAKGDATHARILVNGRRGSGGSVAIEPTSNWRQYELALDMAPGYTEIVIEMNAGGKPDQTLWVDAMEFGPIAR